MRSANSSHIRKLSLRQATLFPQTANAATKADGKRYCHFPMVAVIVASTVRFTEQCKPIGKGVSIMGLTTQILLWGTVVFGVVEGIWWLASGHTSKDAVWWYAWLVGMIIYSTVEGHIAAWRLETREANQKLSQIAEQVQEISEKLEEMESKIDEIDGRPLRSVGSPLDRY